jgi:aminoglycoside 3-N-acetyltransferase
MALMAAMGKVLDGIASDLEAIGLARGDLVIMHSAFKALGLERGSAPADVVATVLSVIGDDGTLVVPTFTVSYSGIWNVEPFAVDRTPGLSNGAITEAARTHPRALRSGHPTYSMAAIGREARRLAAGRERSSPLGRGSMIGDALESGAKILLVGVGNDRNSSLHYAEVVSGVPYTDIHFRAFMGDRARILGPVGPDDVPLPHEYPSCSLGFSVADGHLVAAGIASRGRIGAAPSMLMPGMAAVASIAERLGREPDWLLCRGWACEPCTLRRRRLRERGLI